MNTRASYVALGISLLFFTGCATVEGPSVFPEDPQAVRHYEQGITHLSAGQYELAAAEFKKSLEIENDPYVCHLRLGLALYGQEQFHEAAGQFQHTCESWGGPESAAPLCVLQAVTLQRSGETEQAKDLLKVWSGANVSFVGGAGQWASTASGRLPSGWWKDLAKYLLGETSEEKVLDVSHEDVGFLSYLFVGIENAMSGDMDKAETYLRQVLANVSDGTWRHDLAEIELKNLARIRAGDV